jgi:hypothetical protein
MKKMKFSKMGILILSAGVFIVVLAGLGLVRNGQMKEQSQLSKDLATSEMRLSKVDPGNQQIQLNELNQQLADTNEQLAGVKQKLVQKIASADVTEKFFEIANYYSVNVTIMGTTSVVQGLYGDISCNVISLSASASGDLSNVTDFIIGLNNNFSTGFVQSAQITVTEDPVADLGSASITLIVYSYEGS